MSTLMLVKWLSLWRREHFLSIFCLLPKIYKHSIGRWCGIWYYLREIRFAKYQQFLCQNLFCVSFTLLSHCFHVAFRCLNCVWHLSKEEPRVLTVNNGKKKFPVIFVLDMLWGVNLGMLWGTIKSTFLPPFIPQPQLQQERSISMHQTWCRELKIQLCIQSVRGNRVKL